MKHKGTLEQAKEGIDAPPPSRGCKLCNSNSSAGAVRERARRGSNTDGWYGGTTTKTKRTHPTAKAQKRSGAINAAPILSTTIGGKRSDDETNNHNHE